MVGHDMQPARPIVKVEHVLNLVRQRSGLHDDEDKHEQCVETTTCPRTSRLDGFEGRPVRRRLR